jgi:hypothetical protein
MNWAGLIGAVVIPAVVLIGPGPADAQRGHRGGHAAATRIHHAPIHVPTRVVPHINTYRHVYRPVFPALGVGLGYPIGYSYPLYRYSASIAYPFHGYTPYGAYPPYQYPAYGVWYPAYGYTSPYGVNLRSRGNVVYRRDLRPLRP